MIKINKYLLPVFLFITFLFHENMAQSIKQEVVLMPYPSEISFNEGKFRITKELKVGLNGDFHSRLNSGASRFLRRLDQRTGQFFEQEFIASEPDQAAAIQIRTERKGEVKLKEDESYSLTITSNKVELNATTDIGALRGLETLLQLVQTDENGFYFPAVKVNDSPRFPWRGLLIDVSRHFHPLHVIQRNIDAMAAVKMNVLHLHLTDDQGLRIESKVYPQIQELASEGEYFTQEEIRIIIEYADERGIRVVPEFDVPGHATAWLVAFPELGSAPGPYEVEENAGIFDPTLNPMNEKTYEVLGNFFEEMAALFPDQYFHIGGDENEGKHWDANEEIQQFMKDNSIADNHQLQAYFNTRILRRLESFGKRLVGWDEILHADLPKTAVIQSWRGLKGLQVAATEGYDVILSNGYYIDLMYPARDHYLNDPLPQTLELTEEQKKHVLGGEATMWSELVTSQTIDSRIWPRTAAIAERLWSPADVNDVEEMYDRLAVISRQLEEHGLTHLTGRDIIYRNMTNGKDVPALRTLADLAEPLKGYTRNPGGTMYTMYSPFTLFADLTIADAPLAREFNLLVDSYLQSPDKEKEDRIISNLQDWKEVHQQIKQNIPAAPLLKSVEGLAQNLSMIAGTALEAIQGKVKLSDKWVEDARKTFEKAREQGARTELQVVDAIEKLVMQKAGVN